MATLRDAQDLREAEGRDVEWRSLVQACRDSVLNSIGSIEGFVALMNHKTDCPLGDECEAAL